MENTFWFVVEKRTITWEFSNPIPPCFKGLRALFLLVLSAFLKPYFFTSFEETCKKVCVFDSTSAHGLYNMSKPNVALSSSVNS